jgi:hypothetical protein
MLFSKLKKNKLLLFFSNGGSLFFKNSILKKILFLKKDFFNHYLWLKLNKKLIFKQKIQLNYKKLN